MVEPRQTAVATRRSGLLALYRDTLGPLPRDAAIWFFCGVWAVAALYLSVSGRAGAVVTALIDTVAWLVFFGLLTIPLTAGAPSPVPPADSGSSRRSWPRLAIVLVFVALTGYLGLIFHRDVPAGLTIPPVARFVAYLIGVDEHGPWNPFWVVNPALYVVLPGICLLATGARRRELGFAPGYRAWAMALLWSAVMLARIGVALVTGHLGAVVFVKYVIGNLLQNGFSEEFLFRGALLTRLMPLLGRSWAVVLSSLLFGVWHLGVNTADLRGDYLAGLALGVVSQATFGLAMAIVFLRTRNLLAPSLIHLLADVPLG